MKNLVRKLSVFSAFVVVFGAFAYVSYRYSPQGTEHSVGPVPIEDMHIRGIYFSPEDDVRSALISLIDAERKSIQFAIYTITDKAIAEALIRAHKRGVLVEGIVDRSYGHSRFSKVCVLANARVPIWVYQTAQDERKAGLMHNKFCIFTENKEQKSLVWTGSYNFTKSASEKNQENALILGAPSVIKRYRKYFERLKKASLQISGPLDCQENDEDSESSWVTKLAW